MIGIDLAWGERRSDGLCTIIAGGRRARVAGFDYSHGDGAILDTVARAAAGASPVLLAVDAPLVVPNRTGTRPVDRETSALFHREHAGCHPANAARCGRPVRLLRKLRRMGFAPGWDRAHGRLLAAEVYPHPAIVRFLRLPQIIKYKRGPVARRRQEFRRLQAGLRRALVEHFPRLDPGQACALLDEPWSKPVEDLTDAFVCALIGLWHWNHAGRRSQVIGNRHTGFILLPAELRPDPHQETIP